MLVFVDESGDTGISARAGASDLFVVTLVVFEENDEAQAADDRITLLRRELRKPPTFEFHFQENSDSIRQAFLEAVVPYNFFYFGVVIRDSAIVKIDASGGRRFQRQLASYLKTKVNTSGVAVQHIKKVGSDNSAANNLLQLANMGCGAVARSYRSDKARPEVFRKIIAHREISVRSLPE